ncbi:MAG: hypothetical protein EBR82_76610, partial [Caulobacteraceae bacterium]|nr:hypothetical protein [Caulobacteraceae bacterium]
PGAPPAPSGPVEIIDDGDSDDGRFFNISPLAEPIEAEEFSFANPAEDEPGGGDTGGGREVPGDPLGPGDETTNGFGGVGIDRDGFGVQVRYYSGGDFSNGFEYTPPPTTE